MSTPQAFQDQIGKYRLRPLGQSEEDEQKRIRKLDQDAKRKAAERLKRRMSNAEAGIPFVDKRRKSEKKYSDPKPSKEKIVCEYICFRILGH